MFYLCTYCLFLCGAVKEALCTQSGHIRYQNVQELQQEILLSRWESLLLVPKLCARYMPEFACCPNCFTHPFMMSWQIVPLPPGERITSVQPVSDFADDQYLVMLTTGGFIKRTALSSFATIRSTGIVAIQLVRAFLSKVYVLIPRYAFEKGLRYEHMWGCMVLLCAFFTGDYLTIILRP